MPRRSRQQVDESPPPDPRIKLLATALIGVLDTHDIPLAEAHWLLPDVADRITQEIEARKARCLAQIDEQRATWVKKHGHVDRATLAARLDLDERELATAERLGFIRAVGLHRAA